jgi:hypothetical protein
MTGARLMPSRPHRTGLERCTKAGVSHERARFEIAMSIVRDGYWLPPEVEHEVMLIAASLDRAPVKVPRDKAA